MDPHKKTLTMAKKDMDYPVELESQFILRLPEEPAKTLREVLRLGENFKKRLSILMESDMRHGEVRFDDWQLHAKVVDLPTIVESMKTVDRKSIYKTADISQIMICKHEIDPPTEEESPVKSKKKDPFKVEKKYLFPHGLTPPTKNVRKRRFRKTLKKKSVEAPEIEKEVKRLLRADNEAVSFTWEIVEETVKEEETNTKPGSSQNTNHEKVKTKKEKEHLKTERAKQSSSKLEDIFGGTLSDSDLEEESMEDIRLPTCEDTYTEKSFGVEFSSGMFSSGLCLQRKDSRPSTVQQIREDMTKQESAIAHQLSILTKQLGEMKEKKLKTEQEIAGLQNMTLKQRFKDILQNINSEIAFMEMEYERLSSL